MSVEFQIESTLQFPNGIDEAIYDTGGENCADGMSSDSSKTIVSHCKSSLRPLAAMLYFGVPKLLGSNAVSQSYVLLAMNMILLLLCACALITALCPYTSRGGIQTDLPMQRAAQFAAIGGVFLVLFNTAVGGMTDMPALVFFITGAAICIKTLAQPWQSRVRWFFAAGCMMALAALMKPNYYVYGPIVLGLALAIDFFESRAEKRAIKKLFLNPIYAGLGLSFALIQCFWVQHHAGVFWPYDPASFITMKTPHNWPFVGHGVINNARTRLFDGLDPVPTFNLVLPLDAISHMFVKLYIGIFPQKLEPFSVFEHFYPPARWYPSKLEIAGILLASGSYLTYTAWAACFGPKPVRFLNAVGLFYAVFTMAISHTEYRYYLVPRLILATTLLYYVSYFVLSRKTIDAA
jgi:hypothetical protein